MTLITPMQLIITGSVTDSLVNLTLKGLTGRARFGGRVRQVSRPSSETEELTRACVLERLRGCGLR
jgi:hypothetical protein